MSSPGPTVPRSRWPWLSLLPIGLGAWAPIYAGVRAGVRSWVMLGVLWSALVIAGFVKSSGGHSAHSGGDVVAGFLIIIGWAGAIATSFTIRARYEREMGSPLLEASEAAQQRLHDRRRALELARHDPALAREIGVGRPDRPGSVDVGLVDVNNASATALLKLPGMTGEIATEIIETRNRVDGFSSLEDMGVTLDLDGGVVEGLRGSVVFLPRTPSGAA